MLRTSTDLMKENGFNLAKEKSRRYLTQSITDANFTDDKALLASIPTQAKSLQHRLEWAACGIGLHANAEKTEYIRSNQRGDIPTLNWFPLKIVDKFTFLGSCVSSTEIDINTQLSKAWTAIDRTLVTDLTDKIKRSFSNQLSRRYCYIDVPHGF